MTTKSFTFPVPPEDPKDRPKIELGLNNEKFVLRSDLAGVELLEVIAVTSGPGSVRGIAQFYRRVIQEDDWDRFAKATVGLEPKRIGEICGDLIDAYSSFPTTPEGSSSSG